MSNLEIVLTLAVWMLVGGVFIYYRCLALQPQWEQDVADRHHPRPIGESTP